MNFRKQLFKIKRKKLLIKDIENKIQELELTVPSNQNLQNQIRDLESIRKKLLTEQSRIVAKIERIQGKVSLKEKDIQEKDIEFKKKYSAAKPIFGKFESQYFQKDLPPSYLLAKQYQEYSEQKDKYLTKDDLIQLKNEYLKVRKK